MAPWTEETYKALALSFFENGGPYDVEKQQTVADSMAKFGVQVSWDGIRQHLQKLKKKTPAAGEAGDAPATTTPAKAGKAKAATPKTSRKRKADDTPVAKKAAKKAKKEDDEDVAQPTADDGDEPVPDDDEGTA